MKQTEAQGACRCYATGLGVQPKGVRVGDNAVFKVHTQVPVNVGFSVRIIGPDDSEVGAAVWQLNPVAYECSYSPKTAGLHTVVVKYGDQPIAKSPFEVEVEPARRGRVMAFGPGLKTGVVGFPASFTVETNGETSPFGVCIEGVEHALINYKDNKDGSADVSYSLPTPGDYVVHILNCNGEDLPNSPYTANIRPASGAFDPTKVEASGPGLKEIGNTANKWAEFTVDTRKAGTASLKIEVIDVDYNSVEVLGEYDKDGIFICRYKPRKSVKHNVLISFGDVAIPKSPYRVFIQDASNPSKVKVYGPAIDHPVKIFQPTYLIVDCSEAGPGDVLLAMTNERGLEPSVKTRSNKDNTFRIDFEPTTVGLYVANIFFANEELPGSPYKIRAKLNIDVSKVKVEGLKPRIPAGDMASFDIITKDAGEGQAQVQVSGPSGKFIAVSIEETADGYGAKFTPIEIGLHSVQVVFAGQAVPQSPFRCETFSKDGDSKKVKAYGSGLNGGKANAPAEFTIDTRETRHSSFGLIIEGPSEAKIECFDNQDGTCDVRYWPTEPGEYLVNITCDDKPIDKSPFKVFIAPSRTVDMSSTRARGQ